MKILLITDNFPPEVNAPATRTYEHVKEWQMRGVDVTIITCVPNFPQGKVYKGYSNKLYQTEKMEDIEIVRVWSYIAPNKGKVRRVLDYVSFSFTAFWAGLFRDFDVIIATSPQFFTTWTAYALSKIRRKPWIFELRDLWPDSIKTVGAIEDGIVMKCLHNIEMFLYKQADIVVPVTEAFKANLIKRGIEPEKIKVITNGANLDLYIPREKDHVLIKELDLENKFIIGYIGTHGIAHKLDFILQTISKIEDKDIHFLFIGDGAKKEELMALADKLKLSNITFHTSVSKEKMPQYLSIVDVSLVPLKKSETFKTVIPSKIFEASAMRKPILLGVEGQAQEIIEHYGAGICFVPEDKNDFIEKVLTLKNDKTVYKNCQAGCEKLAHDFDRKKLANKMLEIIKKTI